jgi:hypothetical protein
MADSNFSANLRPGAVQALAATAARAAAGGNPVTAPLPPVDNTKSRHLVFALESPPTGKMYHPELEQEIRWIVENRPYLSIVRQWSLGITDASEWDNGGMKTAAERDGLHAYLVCTKAWHQEPYHHISFKLMWENATSKIPRTYANVHLNRSGVEEVFECGGTGNLLVLPPGAVHWDVYPPQQQRLQRRSRYRDLDAVSTSCGAELPYDDEE